MKKDEPLLHPRPAETLRERLLYAVNLLAIHGLLKGQDRDKLVKQLPK